jgi:regulator of sigma E protease
MLLTLLSFIVVLGVVVFVHELGHFLAAKLVGARVEAFSMGFGKLIGKKVGDTEYRIGYIPLGGYVKIAGMVDEFMEEEGGITGADDEFQSKSTWAKMFMITAGVLMNMILGIIIYSFITLYEGEARIDPSATIGSVSNGYPALDAGIQPGDRIISVNGIYAETWEDFRQEVHTKPEQELHVQWVRGADTLSADIVTRAEEIVDIDGKRTVGMLGVGPAYERVKTGFFRSFAVGSQTTWNIIVLNLKSLKMLVSGSASISDVAGPVGIASMSGDFARAGWITYLSFIGLISISIGLINIMPFPVLDGGHLVYIIIEAIIRRPVSTEIKMRLQQVGIILLIGLVLVVTYHDILRIFK